MIGGKKKTELTIDNVLKVISEYDVFKYYMPNPWEVNDVCLSPFRDEKHPSFLISNRSGSLYYIDFADTSKRGDCFTFVKQLFQLSGMDDVLKLIDRDFGLGFTNMTNTKKYEIIKSEYKQPEDLGKRYALIQVVTRKFTNEELRYWNDYHQDIDDLRRENIYSVAKVYLNRKRFTIEDNQLRFGYFYDGCWKIYRPFETKKRKWMPNNVPITVMDGKNDVKDCDMAFINKSKKDYMVMKKVFPCSCAVQNEGLACFSEENITFLKTNSKRQILSFDSDESGVKNSRQITKMLGFDYCNVPRKYLKEGIKDWADLAKAHGLPTIEKYLKQKQLL